MSYPCDDDGRFTIAESSELRLSRQHGLRIIRCHATREKSGFLVAEELGPELWIPDVFVHVITKALRQGTKEPIKISLRTEDGFLTSSTEREKALWQPLSDWQLELSENKGSINGVISAALCATQPI